MNQENYKGYVICDHYAEKDNKLCYLVCKDYGKVDPYWEIFSQEYETVRDAKFAIDNGELPHG